MVNQAGASDIEGSIPIIKEVVPVRMIEEPGAADIDHGDAEAARRTIEAIAAPRSVISAPGKIEITITITPGDVLIATCPWRNGHDTGSLVIRIGGTGDITLLRPKKRHVGGDIRHRLAARTRRGHI